LAGTPQAAHAGRVYLDLVAGLKDRVQRLERDKTVLLIVCAMLAGALLLSMPFRKLVPYFYEVDSSTGRVSVSTRVVEDLKVSDRNIAYFLRLWTARLVTINAATLKEGLPSAYRWTRGGAQAELDNWTDNTDKTAQRIGKVPGLTREILGVPTVSFNEDRSIAFIDFVWVEKINGIESERRRKLLTVEFGVVSPKDRRGAPEDSDNPLGLAITHFTINDQVSQ